jgi:hypothetical protein
LPPRDAEDRGDSQRRERTRAQKPSRANEANAHCPDIDAVGQDRCVIRKLRKGSQLPWDEKTRQVGDAMRQQPHGEKNPHGVPDYEWAARFFDLGRVGSIRLLAGCRRALRQRCSDTAL